MLAASGNTAVDVVLILSATVPVVITIVLAWYVLRGKRNDPDERLWRLQDAERRRTKERQNPPE
ncbi:MAG TPA: hypothetical protein VH538_05920 [Gaiellaceae bacterium]